MTEIKRCLNCLYYPMCKEIAAGNCTLASEACTCFESTDGWIPVTERLPEEEGNYLCLENGDVRIVFFDKFEQAFGYDRTVVDPEILGWLESEFIPYNVTHGMPLPEPPKEGTE